MKNLLLFLAVIFVGCSSPEPIESYYNDSKEPTQCGVIISMWDNIDYEYIDVRMDYQQPYEKNRYKVDNIYDYKLGGKICDVQNLEQIKY